MRRATVMLVLASALAACGKFLGLGEEEEEPATANDASTEASPVDASACIAVDARVCQTVTDDFASYTEIGQLAPKDWSPFAPQCTNLAVDAGAFVVELPAKPNNDAAPCTTNAGLFRSFVGGVRTLECSFDVTANAVDGTFDFFQYRVEHTVWDYFVAGGVRSDMGFYVRRHAARDGGPFLDEFQPDPGPRPEAGVPFRVHARLDLGGTPTFSLRWREDSAAPLAGDLPDPGAPPIINLYVGMPFTDQPRKVAIDNVTCVACR